MYNSFLSSFLRIFYSSFPLKVLSTRTNSNLWITPGISNSCKHKRDLYLIYRSSNDEAFKRYYRQYCKILKNVIREAKKKHYSRQISKSSNKIRTIWNITKSVTGKFAKVNSVQELKVDGRITKNRQYIADFLNSFFISVAENNINKSLETNNKPLDYLRQAFDHPFPSIKYQAATSTEIFKIIKSLTTKRSHGYDEISVEVLKISSPFIISPLTYISNKMLSAGVFPDRLKYAEIKPCYKGGCENDPSNYRPISLLTSFSKIFEKIVLSRLNQHIHDHNIIVNEQFGFRRQSSTAKASYVLLNEILEALNKQKVVGGVFCDLKKAFDSVNHEILLSKLQYYGIQGRFYDLIASYLSDRHQRVLITDIEMSNTIRSDWDIVRHGVPQGSILGPLLFLFYINDLSTIFNSTVKPVLFADDTSLVISSNNNLQYNRDVNISFDCLNEWFKSNLLTLNFSKTKHVQFAAKSCPNTGVMVNYCNNVIPNSTEVKFLGIIVESTCTWKAHISQLIPKLCKACYSMRVIKPIMPTETLKMIYYCYFHSLLTYGIIFWGNTSFSVQIFRIQKRIIRIMSGLRARDSCRQAFRDWGILPLQSQYIFSLLIFVVNNKGLFHTSTQIHGLNTRRGLDLYCPQTNLTVHQKGPYCYGIKLFNCLPLKIKEVVHDNKVFRVALNAFLHSKSFYTLDEYFGCINE
ncbi:hypothetical protein B7P43_G11183 [Cryptotermes secundus]|nr:hypothetical protein B7P43_G11183 [Cryptotermes secundus]